MSAITTHVLDTAAGHAAAGVSVTLARRNAEGEWSTVGTGMTDGEGRLRTLLAPGVEPEAGIYRLTFETGVYFRQAGVATFFPAVEIVFEIREPAEHYHVPLLLSPYGYSTYRGT